jgi:ankyrin repeat protein
VTDRATSEKTGASTNSMGNEGANDRLGDGAVWGDVEGVRSALADGASVEARDGDGRWAAMLAAQNGHEFALRLLIEAGAKVDAKDDEGWTALLHAADNGHAGCLRALIALGRTRVQVVNGWTAPMLAAAAGDEACVRLLMAAGADFRAKDAMGRDASKMAAINAAPEIVKLIKGFVRSQREREAMARSAGGPQAGTSRRPRV